MTADGFLQSAGRLGAVVGPLIMTARQALPLLPPLTYGVILIVSSFVLPFLPETRGLPLPDTIQDLENQREEAAYSRLTGRKRRVRRQEHVMVLSRLCSQAARS
ncbi:PREDICTED: solute carrier family 22 member 11 isoform X1 [Myotis brandtii]|uniref:solute carrier family 22 member 11 isoform X1 n=1 Tax=Myotis brandtii TaxID=109478 RepID=UPI0003BBECD8|nr:PREDICTED: solute carrier family 22 member 11 isoform X1 [Myotis brandtii]